MPPRESIHKKLTRVRRPRVHITYDVETGGAIEKRDLPFIVGVMADLSGQPEKPLDPLKKRSFDQIGPDNFDAVMAKQRPRLAFKVDNKLQNDASRIGVELRFNRMEDFEPQNVVKQVEPLKQLLDLRTSLANLKSTLATSETLDNLLQSAIRQTEAVKARAKPPVTPDPVASDKEG